MSTKIEWTDESWNPVLGCSRVSEGCRNCYAERMAGRIASMGELGEWTAEYADVVRSKDGRSLPQWNGRVKCLPERLDMPLRWRKPRRIFVNSMSDLFHPEVPFEFVDRVFAVMAMCPHHTFQVLTKRPERASEYFYYGGPLGTDGRVYQASKKWPAKRLAISNGFGWPLANVWLGTSCEDQATADERIPHLLRCPAAVRFVSLEPLLGPINLIGHRDPVTRTTSGGCLSPMLCATQSGGLYERPPIDWVIVGGESGPGARPMHPDWVRAIRDQCVAASVPFFFKQWGAFAPHFDPDLCDHDGTERFRNAYVNTDGSHGKISGFEDAHGFNPTNWCGELRKGWAVMTPCGKRAAGRVLDGRTWDEYPKGGER